MNQIIRHLAIIALLLFGTSGIFASETFSAPAAEFVDGDILRVSRKEGGRGQVRLCGIDCPERNQEHGKEARRLAVKLAYGRIVLIESLSKGTNLSTSFHSVAYLKRARRNLTHWEES